MPCEGAGHRRWRRLCIFSFSATVLRAGLVTRSCAFKDVWAYASLSDVLAAKTGYRLSTGEVGPNDENVPARLRPGLWPVFDAVLKSRPKHRRRG
jgi:hypothetical protein